MSTGEHMPAGEPTRLERPRLSGSLSAWPPPGTVRLTPTPVPRRSVLFPASDGGLPFGTPTPARGITPPPIEAGPAAAPRSGVRWLAIGLAAVAAFALGGFAVARVLLPSGPAPSAPGSTVRSAAAGARFVPLPAEAPGQPATAAAARSRTGDRLSIGPAPRPAAPARAGTMRAPAAGDAERPGRSRAAAGATTAAARATEDPFEKPEPPAKPEPPGKPEPPPLRAARPAAAPPAPAVEAEPAKPAKPVKPDKPEKKDDLADLMDSAMGGSPSP